MCSWRRGRAPNQDGDGGLDSNDVKGYGTNKRKCNPKQLSFIEAILDRFQLCVPKIRGKNCTCLVFYLLFLCFMLVFLYFYAVTLVYQIMKLLRIIAHFVLPASWLKSTKDIVQEALAKYSADRLGLADYAMESAGGSILCSSETYFAKSGAIYSVFGIPLWYHSSSPREVIQPDVQPGKCWAMDGNHGYVMIQLAMPIIISAISLEHIPLSLAPPGRLDSAPKEFMIIGKERAMDSPDVVLGKFTYQIGKEPIQVFDIKDPYCVPQSSGGICEPNNKVYYIVTLKILSNHGNPEFTCIYRLRVHGMPLTVVPAD